MQKRLFAVLVLSLFQGILSSCIRVVDPVTLTLEQFLSDITFEILPYPNYPTCPTYSTYPDYPIYPTCPDFPTYPEYPNYPVCSEYSINPDYPNYPTCPDFPTYPEYPNYPVLSEYSIYPDYPNFPNPCPPCKYAPPYPPSPIDPYQCGYPFPYYPIEFEMTLPPIPTSLDVPCEIDGCPCSCYRDIRDPCIICESAPLNIYFECGTPYIYYPQVEYPMTAMDIKPYYYDSCWCT